MSVLKGEGGSLLADLRRLIPTRLGPAEQALRVAEDQAAKLLAQLPVQSWPVRPSALLRSVKVAVEKDDDLPVTACCFWDARNHTWIIRLNAHEPAPIQRVALLHEFKHIVDHGRGDLLYGTGPDAGRLAERAADHFAACVLMPAELVHRACSRGITDPQGLALAFEVPAIVAGRRLTAVQSSSRFDPDSPLVAKALPGTGSQNEQSDALGAAFEAAS